LSTISHLQIGWHCAICEGDVMRHMAMVFTMFVFALATLFAVVPLPVATAQNATPAAGCPTTTEDENEAVARRWNEEAVSEGKLDVIDEIAAPDIIHHAGTFPDGVGIDAVKGVLGALLTGFPDVKQTIEDVVTEDDLVVIRWTAAGTQSGEFQGVAPTGKQVTWTGINIYRFECGKIAEEWSELDGIGRLRQLEGLATPTP
jgi:steroid delta-isomerase-like uncharacterized protein